MKLILLPLILTAGCVNWTPVEYYDIPVEIEEKSIFTEEIIRVAELDHELCLDEPLGTFSCASIVCTDWATIVC